MGKIVIWLKLSLYSSFASIAIIVSLVEGAFNFGSASGFDVEITNAKLDNIEVSEQAIKNHGTTLSFITKELKSIGDTSVLEYEISNYSKNFDASVRIDCTQNSNEYYTIHNNFPVIIKANSKESGNLVVVLKKSSDFAITDDFSCLLNISAVNEHDFENYEYIALRNK